MQYWQQIQKFFISVSRMEIEMSQALSEKIHFEIFICEYFCCLCESLWLFERMTELIRAPSSHFSRRFCFVCSQYSAVGYSHEFVSARAILLPTHMIKKTLVHRHYLREVILVHLKFSRRLFSEPAFWNLMHRKVKSMNGEMLNTTGKNVKYTNFNLY